MFLRDLSLFSIDDILNALSDSCFTLWMMSWPQSNYSGTQYFDCCSVKYMCSAHSQLCQTPSKICISSCMDISIARSLLLHFQCWFPVSLKNLARFWVFGFSFGFISCRPHSKNAYHGHCFHFLSCVDIPSIK